jgi:CRISPR/Cas system-associated protein Cas10 (large subunit of type III CRISPR-Cas system)
MDKYENHSEEWREEDRQRSQGMGQCEACGNLVPKPELQSLWRDAEELPSSVCHTCYSDYEEEERGEDLRDAGERDPRELI